MAKRGRKAGRPTGNGEDSPEPADLITILERAGKVPDSSDRELISIDLGDPSVAASHISKVMQDWERSGAAAVFQSQQQLAQYYQAAMIGIFVRYVNLITRSLDLLGRRLDDDDMRAPQFLSLAERFTEQLGFIKRQAREVFEPLALPENEADLDRRLIEAREKLRQRGGE